MKNKKVIWVLIVVIISILAVLGLHLYLLISKQGYQVHIGTFNIIRLGSPDVFFPKEFEKSFVPFDAKTPDMRKPRYERNVTYVSAANGDFVGKDIETGQETMFSWNDYTHYLCLAPEDYAVPGIDPPVDPIQGLKNYIFLNTGNDIAGVSVPEIGYLMFRRDVAPGTPVKFMLRNESLNGDGAYDVLTAIAFTTHAACVTANDVTADLPNIQTL